MIARLGLPQDGNEADPKKKGKNAGEAAAKKAGVGVGHDPMRANKRLALRAHQPEK